MNHTEQKKLLTQISPGTPMHDTLKRYWLPLCLSSDLPTPGGDPVRVRALGQDYVLFRNREGKLGLLDEACTHRSASLCLGRTDGAGIRCLYHGWEYDVDGKLLDAPNVQDPRFKDRVRQPAYAVREAGDMIWGYFGKAEQEPPFPKHPWFDVEPQHRVVEIIANSSNFTRIVEGLIDTTHTGSLHKDALTHLTQGSGPTPPDFGTRKRVDTAGVLAKDLAPTIEVEETDFGLRYAAISRFTEDGTPKQNARVTSFVQPAGIYIHPDNIAQLVLPVDNDRSLFFMIWWDTSREIATGEAREQILKYYGIDSVAMDTYGLARETHDLPDRPNRANNWLQDREAMERGESYTGMYRFIPEDWAMNESMGAAVDSPIEHLVPADLAVARYRRQMVANAQAVARGEDPIGINPKDNPQPANFFLSGDQDWREYFRTGEYAK